MMKIQKIVSIMLLVVTLSFGLVSSAGAVAELTTDTLGLKYGADIGLGSSDVRTTIASVIRVIMSLLGIVAVVIILIGGFTWMTAGGNDDKVAEAKKWIFSGVIGLVIILSAYALASFVISQLVSATTGKVMP